jgi:hypothetical protein
MVPRFPAPKSSPRRKLFLARQNFFHFSESFLTDLVFFHVLMVRGASVPLTQQIDKQINNTYRMNTFTEKIGIVTQTISYMQDPDNQAVLKAKNFDVTPHIARLQGELGTVNSLKPVQKKAEVAHINATSNLNDASYGAYNDASGVIDAMAGLLGKGTPEAKKLQSIRSKVRKHSPANPPTPPPPVTAEEAAAAVATAK